MNSSLLNNIKVAYVILPKDQEGSKRRIFVENSIRKSKISLIFDKGDVAHDCYVSQQCIGNIVFPEKFGETGSCVLTFIDPFHNHPFVFATINKENDFNYFTEGQNRLFSQGDGNLAEVTTSTEGKVYINVSNDNSGGEININVNNKDKTGKLNIKILGESNIYSSGKINVQSNEEINAEVLNAEEETKSYVNIKKGEGIDINDEFGNRIQTNSDQEIIFNKNRLSSFIADINNLVAKYNLIEQDINDLKTAFNSWIVVATDGGAALKTITATWYGSPLDETTVDDIKDERIKN